jgi:putative transposase
LFLTFIPTPCWGHAPSREAFSAAKLHNFKSISKFYCQLLRNLSPICQWHSPFLTDLQNRGVRDILICCIDGLKGFPDAIQSVFPESSVQLCIVHQIRNSIKYVGSKHQKEFIKDLRTVYGAVNKDSAAANLDLLESKWGEMYPIVIKSWRDNWERLTEYFQYTPAIRKLIYTTNTVEGYHRQVRKVTKTKGVFPTDNSLEKLVYLAYRNIRKKWTMPLANWGQISQQLAIKFGDRFKIM